MGGPDSITPIWARKRALKDLIWTIFHLVGSEFGRGANVRGPEAIRGSHPLELPPGPPNIMHGFRLQCASTDDTRRNPR